MEEIKFKPSIKLEKKISIWILIVGIILIFISMVGTILISNLSLILTVIVIGISFFLFIGIFFSIISKIFSEYTITNNNEIQETYDFIVKSSKLYRIDQVTSITLRQGFFQKLVNLATISYGIFGNDSLLGARKANQNQASYNSQKFNSIENHKNIFENLASKINVTKSKEISIEKPSLKPVKFWRNIWLFFTFITLIGIGLNFTFVTNKDLLILGILGGGILAVIFSMFAILSMIDILKIKSTKYIITQNSLIYTYDYIFAKKISKVPLSKITNTQVNKNLISYFLFKVGGVKVFTGGNNDPYFKGLENFETFSKTIINNYTTTKTNINLNIKKQAEIKTKTKTNEPQFSTKPKISFFLEFILWLSIFFGIMGITLTYLELTILNYVLVGIWFIAIILRFILWKNTSYEFYENKVIDKSGIINITTKEIQFKNLKYVSLSRKLFFERIFSQGTIILYTAGTGMADNKISNIKEYDDVFKTLSNEIIE